MFSLIVFVVLIAVFCMGFWAFYVWWKKDRHTRERFAFYGFTSLFGFGTLFCYSLMFKKSLVGTVVAALSGPLGIQHSPVSGLEPLEAVMFVIVLLILRSVFLNIFKHWGGQKSQPQYEQEVLQERPSVLHDVHLFVFRNSTITPCQEGEATEDVITSPAIWSWHDRVRELWTLKYRTYKFEGHEYNPEYKFWLGNETHTGALVALLCYSLPPQDSTVLDAIAYLQKVAANRDRPAGATEIILATREGTFQPSDALSGHNIRVTNEQGMMDKLVDFSDYFYRIRQQIESDCLIDSELTLNDVYVPSFYRLSSKEDKPSEQSLEACVFDWLSEPTRQQLAILGDYGQGKSTISKFLVYRLMQQLKTNPDTRIPVLIELRGKNLRTLSPEALLADWAYSYGVSPKALLQMNMAGRLLLIFDGFDEMDLSGDPAAHIQHFKTLWSLNFEQSKIIITGRPNFFIDSQGLKSALGDEVCTRIMYLFPFTEAQMAKSLRSVDSEIREGILALTRKDKTFEEVAARPSLLYMISTLWKSNDQNQGLSDREHINSALVIDLFIRKTLQRESDKQKYAPSSDINLNQPEYHYFMMGIAGYMLIHKQPNQINRQQLKAVVKMLIDAIPASVSQQGSAAKNETNIPLRDERRFDRKNRHEQLVEKITQSIHTSSLLVNDPNKDGSFKFAHKSYMELLQAQLLSDAFFCDNKTDRDIALSITNTLRIAQKRYVIFLEDSPEVATFFVELLQEHWKAQKIIEEKEVAKKLWDMFFLQKKQGRLVLSNINRYCCSMPSIWTMNILLNIFVRTKLKNIAKFIMGTLIVLFIVALPQARFDAFFVFNSVDSPINEYPTAEYIFYNILFLIIKLVVLFIIFYPGFMLILPIMNCYSYLTYDINEYPFPISGYKQSALWYRSCLSLKIPDQHMEGIVGKGMLALLKAGEEERETS